MNEYKLLTKCFLAFLASLLILSCGKKDDVPASDTHLLYGKWQLTQVRFTETGPFLEMPIAYCQRDDVVEFKADKVFVRDNGQNLCNPQESSIIVSKWSIYQEAKVIVFEDIEYQILSLSQGKLELYREVQGGLNGKVLVQYYYIAK